jgi:SOS-response transcriptional repressor LexA
MLPEGKGESVPGTPLTRPLDLEIPVDPVSIKVLNDAAAAGEPRLLNPHDVRDLLVVTRKMCPHPERTLCIPISGDSMSPVLEDGYLVVVDTAQADHSKLCNQMVAARDPEGGVTIKWLRKIGRDELLVAQHTSTRYQPIILNREPGWEVIGRVLWWIGRPK